MIIASPIKDETGEIKKNKKHDAPTKVAVVQPLIKPNCHVERSRNMIGYVCKIIFRLRSI